MEGTWICVIVQGAVVQLCSNVVTSVAAGSGPFFTECPNSVCCGDNVPAAAAVARTEHSSRAGIFIVVTNSPLLDDGQTLLSGVRCCDRSDKST